MLPKYEQKIKDIQSMIAELMGQVVEANKIALEAYKAHDNTQYDAVRTVLKSIDAEANAIDNEIVKTFALFGPEAQELRMLVAYLKLTNELLRIAEGSKKYARRMKEHGEGECNLAPFDDIIIKLHTTSLNAMQYIEECFNKPGECNVEELYRKIMVEESKNDDLFSILEKEIMTQIMSERELSVEYVRVLGTLRKLERTCDRAVNIANLLLYAAKGGEINIY
jgi:phosphate transport system protein